MGAVGTPTMTSVECPACGFLLPDQSARPLLCSRCGTDVGAFLGLYKPAAAAAPSSPRPGRHPVGSPRRPAAPVPAPAAAPAPYAPAPPAAPVAAAPAGYPGGIGTPGGSWASLVKPAVVVFLLLILVAVVWNSCGQGRVGRRQDSPAFSQPTPLPATLFRVTVKEHTVNVREAPSTTSGILAKVHRGDRFDVVADGGEWYRVILTRGRATPAVGWIAARLADRDRPPTAPVQVPPPEPESDAEPQPTVGPSVAEGARDPWGLGTDLEEGGGVRPSPTAWSGADSNAASDVSRGAGTGDGAATEPASGRWVLAGELLQSPGNRSFPVEIALSRRAGQDIEGTVSYPTLQCTSRLELTRQSSRTLYFREVIESGNCVSGVAIALTVQEDGTATFQQADSRGRFTVGGPLHFRGSNFGELVLETPRPDPMPTATPGGLHAPRRW